MQQRVALACKEEINSRLYFGELRLELAQSASHGHYQLFLLLLLVLVTLGQFDDIVVMQQCRSCGLVVVLLDRLLRLAHPHLGLSCFLFAAVLQFMAFGNRCSNLCLDLHELVAHIKL